MQFFKWLKVDIRGRCGKFSTGTTNHDGVSTSVDDEEEDDMLLMRIWTRMN